MDQIKQKIAALTLALMTLSSGMVHASAIKDDAAVETMGIFFRGLEICHQEEWRNMSVSLEYISDDGSDLQIQEVKQFVRTFLEEYSKPADFWEIMNIKLVRALSEEFPALSMIESRLSLSPDVTLGFPRETIVKYRRGEEYLAESFKFTKLNYLICQETFRKLNLNVCWDMKLNPGQFDYPDYQWIDQTMEEFFHEHPVSFSEWKNLKPMLEEYLLQKYPTLTSINVEVTIVE